MQNSRKFKEWKGDGPLPKFENGEFAMLNEDVFVTGFYENGEPSLTLSIGDRISPDKNYRMVFQVEKNGVVLSNKVDLTFSGMDLIAKTLARKTFMKSLHEKYEIDAPFEFWFRHQMKEGVIAYCYDKIFGKSPNTRRLTKSITGWSSKEQKIFLKDFDLIDEVLSSYLFMKIEEGFDSILVNDRFEMTEEEIEMFLEKGTHNPETLMHGYGGDIEKMKQSLRNGVLQSIPFNMEPSATKIPN